MRTRGFLAVVGVAVMLTACSIQIGTSSTSTTGTPSDQAACLDWQNMANHFQSTHQIPQTDLRKFLVDAFKATNSTLRHDASQLETDGVDNNVQGFNAASNSVDSVCNQPGMTP
jgi:hypothetical protein